MVRWRMVLVGAMVFAALPATANRVMAEYQRPVEAAPSEKDIGGGYVTPKVQQPLPRSSWWQAADVGFLGAAMGLSAWFVLKRRSRRALVVLTIGCLLYLGFYRKGCVCPIGAIQNVAVALTDPSYAIGYVVIAFFFLPLVMSLFFGRVFCGGVCPLGAIQDLVVVRPVQVPRRLDRALGSLKYIYLAAAIWFAVQPAAQRDFLICRFDPFVGLFRMTGPGYMLMLGGAFLVVGMFVGRMYCRYLCPYGAILGLLSRFAWRGVTITPGKEIDCGLCVEACPFGAIDKMRAIRSSCLFCARCYALCPQELAKQRPTDEPVQMTVPLRGQTE
jgi:NosR/NirI family transcriptional regulator, nitrous oxide reductase regulator